MKPNPKLRYAVLTRVSTERQAERGHSLQAQTVQIERAVNSLGGEITARYGNNAEHATRNYERKEFDRLMADVPKGIFDAVIVTDPSRWSRDNRRSKDGLDLLKIHKIRFFVLAQEQDLYSPEATLALGIVTEANDYFVQRMLKSSAAGRIAGARKGRAVIGGCIPWGRRFDKAIGVWSVDPECQRLAERMYSMYVDEQMSFRAIGEAIADPQTMQPMDENTVRRRLEKAGPRWKQTINFEGREEVIECQIPALLSEEQVAHIGRISAERRLVRYQPKYPLSHLVRCAHCGSVFSHHHVRSGNHALPQYRHDIRVGYKRECTKFVYREALEREVFSRFGAILKDEQSLREAVRAGIVCANVERERMEKQLEQEVRELSRLRKASRNLQAVIEESAEAPLEYVDRVTILEKQIKGSEVRKASLEEKLKIVELPQDLGIRVRAELDQLIGANGQVVQFWPTEAKRKLVEFFFGGQTMRTKGKEVGVFVEMRQDTDLGKYWVWEARGLFGVIAGALSDYIYLQDKHFEEMRESVTVSPELARTLINGTNAIHQAHERWSGSGCRGKAPRRR